MTKEKELITIKELADTLGYSKQRIQQIIDKLPTNKKPKKQGNRFVLSSSNVEDIKFLLGIEVDKRTTNNQQVDKGTVVDEIFLKQLEEKDEQIKTLHKLLDQQQQLTLQANKKIEQLDTAQQDEDIISKKEVPDLEEVEPDPSPKKSFWKRLFP